MYEDPEAEAAPFWAWRPVRAPPEAGIPGWDMTTVVIRVGRGWSRYATAPSEEMKGDYWKRRERTTVDRRRGGEREAHQALGLAPHSPQPTSGHDLAWELRVGSRVGGAGNAALEGSSQAEEQRGPSRKCQPPAAQAQWGHVALPAPGWRLPPQSVLSRRGGPEAS